MAAGATIYTFAVQVADVDRNVYEELTLRVARHPSETAAFMLTRVLAYCLEFEEGIAFGEGISTTEEPAVVVRDATGALTAWIEVGAPDSERLHTGSMRAGRTVVYTHRDPEKVAAGWAGRRIHRAEDILLRSFDRDFIERAAAVVERRTHLSVSVIEQRLYLDIDGSVFESDVHERSAG